MRTAAAEVVKLSMAAIRLTFFAAAGGLAVRQGACVSVFADSGRRR